MELNGERLGEAESKCQDSEPLLPMMLMMMMGGKNDITLSDGKFYPISF
jgi:hypothetical protein